MTCKEPKLRTVNKVAPPYGLNDFPGDFIHTFAREVVYLESVKAKMSLEGEEWEQIFAKCIGAKWKPSNVGLDDVVLGNCCWSAKTVYSGGNVMDQSQVRLISGRNSPTYSYDAKDISKNADPDEIGYMVLEIWNERVSAIREVHKFARTVVLVKSRDFRDYLVFEFDTVRYDAAMFRFSWNTRGNLEGHARKSGAHRFTWQPSGSQFTIIEPVPEKVLHVHIKRKPKPLDIDYVLNGLGFDETWYTAEKMMR